MSYLLYDFGEMVKLGLTISLLLLFVAHAFEKEWPVFIKQWLLCAYLIAFICCIEMLLVTVMSIIYASDYWLQYAPWLTLQLIFVISFLFKRVRNSFAWGLSLLIAFHWSIINDWSFSLSDYKWPVNYGGIIPAHPVLHYFFGDVLLHLGYFLLFSSITTGIYFIRRYWLNRKPAI